MGEEKAAVVVKWGWTATWNELPAKLCIDSPPRARLRQRVCRRLTTTEGQAEGHGVRLPNRGLNSRFKFEV